MFRILTLTTLLLTAWLSLGCDQQALDQQQTQQALDKAQTLLDRSNMRYIPADAEQEQPWSKYRQTLLDQASTSLDSIIANGDPGQKLIAQQLKARIMLSTARMMSDSAMADFRQIALQAAATTDSLAAVNTSNNRVRTLDFSAQPAIQTLNDEIDSLEQKSNVLNAERQKLEDDLKSLQSRAASLREQAEQSTTRADELKQQAFVATGNKQDQLEDQSAEVELLAADLMAKRDLALAEAQALQSKLALTVVEIGLIADSINALQTASQETASLDAKRKAARRESQAAVAATSTKLLASVDAYLQLFSQQVETPMTEATERFGDAARLFEQAGSQARGSERNTMLASELTTRINQAQVMTSHAIALGDMARLVRFIETTGNGLSDDQKSKLKQAYDSMKQRQDEVLAAMKESDNLAQATADKLPEDQSADRMAQLRQFSDMAGASRLQ